MTQQLSRGRLTQHAPSVIAVMLAWAVVAVWLRLYRMEYHPRPGGRLRKMLNAAAMLSVLLIAYGFLARQIGADDVSRSFVLLFAPVSLLLLLAANYAVLAAS